MPTPTNRQQFQKITNDRFAALIKKTNGIITFDLAPATVIHSSALGLSSPDYIIIENEQCSNLTIKANWSYVIFNRCNITSARFVGKFNSVYFLNCDLANSDFSQAENFYPEQVYTSQHLDQALFPNDQTFKQTISDLVIEERKVPSNNIIRELFGDFSPIHLSYQELILTNSEQSQFAIPSQTISLSNLPQKNKGRNI